jgi:hypothetical protein
LPMHDGQRHFLLLGGGRPGWRVRVEREFGSHLMDIRIATDQSRHPVPRVHRGPQGTRRACLGAIPHISNSRTRRRRRQRRDYGEVVYVACPEAAGRSSGAALAAKTDGLLHPATCNGL